MKRINITERIKDLAALIIKYETNSGISWPHNMGGRQIDLIAGGKLSLDDWTQFHHAYRCLAPDNLLSNHEVTHRIENPQLYKI